MARKSQPLPVALNQYERHLRARGLAANTVNNNAQVMRRAIALWGDITVASVTPAHVDQLFAHYGWRESTRNLYLSYLRGFFVWASRCGMAPRDFDPTAGWRTIRVPETDKLRVPVEDFGRLLDAAAHPRDRALCAIGLYTFLRGSEIQRLRVADLDLDNHALHIYRPKTKSGDRLPVCTELAGEMVRWLNWYRADQGPVHQTWYLIPAKNPTATFYDPATGRIGVSDAPAPLRPDKPIHRPYMAVQRALERLGLDTYWQGEHTLRRSGARALADQLRTVGHDAALMRVASMLGHKDIRVTQTYIGWDTEREQRDIALAGKPMFDRADSPTPATITPLRERA